MEEGRFLAFTCLKKKSAHTPKTKSNQATKYTKIQLNAPLLSCGYFLLCPSLERSDHFLVVIMQVNTQKKFYVWEDWLWFCALLFVRLFVLYWEEFWPLLSYLRYLQNSCLQICTSNKKKEKLCKWAWQWHIAMSFSSN